MVDLKTAVRDVRETLVAELADDLLAIYLFGAASRGEFVPGRSDVDFLLVVDPQMPVLAARNAFRPLWGRHGDIKGQQGLICDLIASTSLWKSCSDDIFFRLQRYLVLP